MWGRFSPVSLSGVAQAPGTYIEGGHPDWLSNPVPPFLVASGQGPAASVRFPRVASPPTPSSAASETEFDTNYISSHNANSGKI